MPLFSSYDIIFAGGGTVACIIAGRLAQADPSLKILIIEAGSHSLNLHHHVQPARYLNNLVQGHTFTHHNSGGSAVNFLMYTRAPSSDYDDWERLGNPGWGSESLIPLAKKASDRYIDSRTGKRSDTAHHFVYNLQNFSLEPSDSSNLHVLTNRRVVKVIFRNTCAIGVEYVTREDFNGKSLSQPRIAYASRLVVLSSGAFGSPAILERSGIGAARHVAEANVQQIVDLPGVGENYNDHNLCLTSYLASEDSDCLDGIFSGDEEAIKPHLKEWQEKGSGLLAHNSIDAGVKLRPTSEELEELGPSFRQLWKDFYVGAPDKPVAILCPTAGL
ncbi:hypothetical protein HHX47_DHR2000886 [Lentinula edodes]|nr:hypothetical protein HHX47_DHR2000886 [Lentinula edodes]